MSSKKKDTPRTPQIYAARTEVGCVREHNEDSLLATSPLFVVADGMGGHEAGEVASEIAIIAMGNAIPDGPDAEALAAAVRQANADVLTGAENGTGRPGMGTTLTAALVYGDEVVLAQVGDSRAYLLHEGALQRLTRDHSLVADLVDQGRITEEEARVHPQRSVITRALGSDPDMEPDTYRLQVTEGDLLMLCSDGLTSMVDDATIEQTMRENHDVQACCDALVAHALEAGGLDNVTVVVVDPLAELDDDEDEDDEDMAATCTADTSEDAETDANADALKEAAKEAAKAKSKAKKKGRKGPIAWVIAVVVLIALAVGGVYAWAQNSYYLIAEDGLVVAYKGLPGEFAGISLSWVQDKTDIPVDGLAPATAKRLEKGISVDSWDEAQSLMETYREDVAGTEAAAAQEQSQNEQAGDTASSENENDQGGQQDAGSTDQSATTAQQ